MREQVIAQKVGNRSGLGGQRRSSAVNQRPTRRESGGGALVARLRVVLGYLPAFLKVALAIAVGILIFAGYRVAASASFFRFGEWRSRARREFQPMRFRHWFAKRWRRLESAS